MSKQINVALNFSANTQQAKASLQDLQTHLTKIAYGTDIKVNPGQMQQASSAAKELAFHLNQAYNATTGNFDLTRLNTSLKSAGTNITQLSTKLLSAGQTGQEAFVKLAQTISMAEAPVIRVNNLLSRMGTTFMNTFRYQIASSAITGFVSAMSGAIDYAKELNGSLNNIRIVTGYGQEEMSKFAVEANKAAKALSTTTTAYTDASLIFYQQGLSGEAVKERADVVVKLANVTGQSAEVVSDQMTAIWNNFDDGSKSMEYYADVITKLGAATASSTDEISDGLEKFAAVSETVGLSYEMATAALATVTAETRQSADVVGTAFKTIFSRMEGLKLGETLDDGTTLNQYSQALATAGVNIKDQNGQMREMDDILIDLGAKWQTLNKDQQIALAQSVAGVRQYNQFIALMGNWDKVQENLDVAINSTGELNDQADIYAESWEAARDRVTASLEAVYTDVFKDDFFIDALNGLSTLIDGVHGFLDSVGGIGPVLIGLSGVLMGTFANKIPAALQNLKNNFLITFGQGAKVIQDMNNQTQQMIANELNVEKSGRQYNELQKQQLTNAGQLSNLKAKYAMQEEKLSSAEKAKYQFEIQGIQLVQQELEELAQKTMEHKKYLSSLEKELDLEASLTEMQKEQEKAELNARKARTEAQKNYAKTVESAGEKKGIGAKQAGLTKMMANQRDDIADLEKKKQAAAAKYAGVDRRSLTGADRQESLDISEKIRLLEEKIQKRATLIAQRQEEINSINQAKEALNQANAEYQRQMELSERQTTVASSLQSSIVGFARDIATTGKTELNLSEAFEGEIAQINELLSNGVKDGNFKAKARGLVEELKTTIPEGTRELLNLDSVFDKINTEDNSPKQIEKDFKNLVKALQNTTLSSKDLEKALKTLKFKPDEVKKIKTSLEELARAEEEAKLKAANLQKQIDSINFAHTVKGSEAFASALGGLSSMAFALQSFTQVWKTIADPDMSGWEKFLSITMGITMALPMFGNAMKSLGVTSQWLNGVMLTQVNVEQALQVLTTKDITLKQQQQALMAMGLSKEKAYQAAKAIDTALTFAQSEAEEELTEEQKTGIIIDTLKNNGLLKGIGLKSLDTINIKLQTWAVKQKTKADMGETSALWAKFAALVATNWIMLAIVAVLAIIITSIVLIAKLLKDDSQEKAIERIERSKTALEDTKKILEQMSNQLTDLKQRWDTLKDSEKTLEGLKKGTQEWEEALFKVNQEVKGLVEAFPNLKKFLTIDEETGAFKLDPKAIADEQKRIQESQNLASGLAGFSQDYSEKVEYENYVASRDFNKTSWAKRFFTGGHQSTGADYSLEIGNNASATKYYHDNLEETLANLIEQGKINSLSTEQEILNAIAAPYLEAGHDAKVKWENKTSFDAISSFISGYEKSKAAGSELGQENNVQIGGHFLSGREDYETIKNKNAVAADYGKALNQSAFDYYAQNNLSKLENSNFGKSSANMQKFILEQFGVSADKVTYEKGKTIIDGEEYINDALLRMYALDQSKLLVNANDYIDKYADINETAASIYSSKSISNTGKEMIYDASGKLISYDGMAIDEKKQLTSQDIQNKYGNNIDNDMATKIANIINNSTGTSFNEEIKGASFWDARGGSQYQEWYNSLSNEEKTLALQLIPESSSFEKLKEKVKTEFSESIQDGIAQEESEFLEKEEIDEKEFDAYKELLGSDIQKELKATGKTVEEVYGSMNNYIKALSETAQANKRMEKGTTKLAENWEDWNSVMSDSDASAEELSKIFPDVKEAVQDVLNLDTTEFSLLPNNFAQKHWDLITDVVNGVEGAVDELRDIAGQEILMQVDGVVDANGNINQGILDVHNAIASFDNSKFTVGVALDPEDEAAFYTSCQSMINSAQMTQKEASAYFASMGYDVKFNDNPQKVNEQVTEYKYTYDYDENGEPIYRHVTPIIKNVETEIDVPTIETITPNGSYGGGIGVNTTAPKTATSKKSGGSGSKKETKEKKKASDETERYHEINKQIDKLARGYDKLENAKSKASGKDLINLMQEEQKLMENDLKLQKDYAKEIDNYLKQDRSAIEAYGAKIKNGLIVNYDELVEQQVAKYNAAVDKYSKSSQSDADKEAFEKAEEDYEKFQELLEKYEETYELSLDQEQTIAEKELELWEQHNAIIIETIDQRVEAFEKAVEAYDAQMEWLEYKLEKLEDQAFATAKAFAEIEKQLTVLNGQDNLTIDNFIAARKQWMEALKDSNANEDQKDSAWDAYQNSAEAMISLLETYQGMWDSAEGQFAKHLEDQADAFAEASNELEYYNSLLSSYNDIVELLGRQYVNTGITRDIAKAQVANSKISIQEAVARRNVLKAEVTRLDNEILAAAGDEARKKMLEDQRKEYVEQFREAEEAILETWQAGLEAVATEYETSIQTSIANIQKMLIDSDFYSLEEAKEFYDQQKELSDLRVEEYDKLYQLNKLTRNINKSISELDSVSGNARLSKLLDEINKKKAAGVEMSQYELDTVQKRYDLLMAEIALEEAKDAKDSMRLMRDSQGNWSYVYSANQEAIDAAQQKVDDAKHELEKSSREYIDEMSEAILQNESDMVEALSEINPSDYASKDEYQAAIDRVINFYSEKEQYYYQQIEKSISDINEAYGEVIISFENLTLAQTKGISSIEQGLSKFTDAAQQLNNETGNAFDSYLEGVDDLTNTAGFNIDNLGSQVSSQITNIGTATQELSKNINALADAVGKDFETALEKLGDFMIYWNANVKPIMDNIEGYIETLYLTDISDRGKVSNFTKGWSENIDYNAKMLNHVLSGKSTSDSDFYGWVVGRRNKIEDEKYSQWGNIGFVDNPTAMALMSAASGNKDIMSWVNKVSKEEVKQSDADKALEALKEFNINFDYTGIMRNYYGAGGSLESDLFKILWNHFLTKLTKPYNGTTYGREFFGIDYNGSEVQKNVLWNMILPGQLKPEGFATGGYTGEWGPEGKLALLHEKELILNQTQTKDFLSSLELMSRIIDVIDKNTKLAAAGLAIGGASAAAITEKVIQQNVSIEANFPGVTSAIEIEEALNNIINDAVQFASER